MADCRELPQDRLAAGLLCLPAFCSGLDEPVMKK